MLRTCLLATAVALTAATVPCALAQEPIVESPSPVLSDPEKPPSVTPMQRPYEPHFAFLFFRGLVGELVGALPGALIALVSSWLSCNDVGEGWASGFTCTASVGYAVTMGAFSGVPLGAAIGMHHASSERGYDGNFGWALLASYGGLAIGAVITTGVIAAYDEPTWGAILGGAVGAILASVFGSMAYRAGIPSPRARAPGSTLLVPRLALGPDGVSLGLWGAW